MEDRVKIFDKSFRIYIREQEIQQGVLKCAMELNMKYANCSSPPLVISLLNGAAFFTVDLVRRLEFMTKVDFIKYSSYDGLDTTGEHKRLIGLKESIEGQDVILVDDIIDSGYTIQRVVELVKEQSPKSITVVALIYKPTTIKTDVNIDHYAIKMLDDAFIVGYGLDYNEVGRTLSDIYILD